MSKNVNSRIAEEIRKQLFRQEFQHALNTRYAAIQTDDVFEELLRRLEIAERK